MFTEQFTHKSSICRIQACDEVSSTAKEFLPPHPANEMEHGVYQHCSGSVNYVDGWELEPVFVVIT